MIRAVTAIILGVGAVAAVWWLPLPAFAVLVVAIAALGLVEYGRMFLPDRVERGATVAAGAVLAAAMGFCPAGGGAAAVTLATLLFALSLLFMGRTPELPGVAGRLGLSALGVLYLGLAFGFWTWLRQMGQGRELVLLALVPACLCDTFAYAAGKAVGRHRLAPLVSPGKTWEGFIGALAGSLVGVLLVRRFALPGLSWRLGLALALVVWLTASMGDLIESMFKRSAGVKDSGTIVPGHGGVLDRLDALVFTGPAAYAFARYVIGV